MNEGLHLPQKLSVDVRNPAGQKVRWNGQLTSHTGAQMLERNRVYHPLAFHTTKTMVFLKLMEFPQAWFEASAFEEVFDGRN